MEICRTVKVKPCIHSLTLKAMCELLTALPRKELLAYSEKDPTLGLDVELKEILHLWRNKLPFFWL
jgi:hypothetical protein